MTDLPRLDGHPTLKGNAYPTGGRRKTWREPRLSDDAVHPVEVERFDPDSNAPGRLHASGGDVQLDANGQVCGEYDSDGTYWAHD